jgi:DNA-binding winged helix-turn-helix (wHTH) protein/TolB-like protein
MTLNTRVLYEFDRFVLDPAEQSLLRDGEPVSLTPKAFGILCVLIQNNGRLLDKDELIKAVWPNSYVEEANLSVNISALRRVLGDTPDGQKFIGTVPKRGYRFVMPVHEVRSGSQVQPECFEVPSDGALPSDPQDVATQISPQAGARPIRKSRARVRLALALLLSSLALGMIGYGTYRQRAAQRAPTAKLRRLAILPLQNLNRDPKNDFLGFSLADAIITKLGYVSALTVRPSYAIQKYRDQVIDIPRAAAELNVDTLLTGTFIREGDDLRVTSQLVDVKTQTILWKDTFDLKYDKLRTVQDNVAQQIIKGLALNLTASEAERMQPVTPTNPLAYEYYLRGVDLYSRGDFGLALKMLENSTQIDSAYAPAWAQLGRAYSANASFQFGGRDHYQKAQGAFERALSLQPVLIEVRVYMANLLTDTGQVEQAVPLLREALKANPNQAEVHWELGYAYRFAGMLEESVAECERARALDPGVKLNTSALNAYLYLAQYDKFIGSLPGDDRVAFNVFYRGFGEYYKNEREKAAQDFNKAYELEPALLQAQVGEALREGIENRQPKGVAILHEAEKRVEDLDVRDPEATYKIAQAYSALDEKRSALRVLERSVDKGFFPYPYLAVDPLLDNLRREPAFASIVQKARQRHEAFKRSFF